MRQITNEEEAKIVENLEGVPHRISYSGPALFVHAKNRYIISRQNAKFAVENDVSDPAWLKKVGMRQLGSPLYFFDSEEKVCEFIKEQEILASS